MDAKPEVDPGMLLFSPEAADDPHGPYRELLDTLHKGNHDSASRPQALR